MQNTPLRVYVGIIVALSAGSLFLADWSPLNDLSTEAWTGLLALVILGLISESLSLTIRVGGSSGSSSITFLPLLTCVLLFGRFTHLRVPFPYNKSRRNTSDEAFGMSGPARGARISPAMT